MGLKEWIKEKILRKKEKPAEKPDDDYKEYSEAERTEGKMPLSREKWKEARELEGFRKRMTPEKEAKFKEMEIIEKAEEKQRKKELEKIGRQRAREKIKKSYAFAEKKKTPK